MACSRRRHLKTSLGRRAVDTAAQRGTGVDEGGLLASGDPRTELGTGPHGRRAPLHAGVLQAELGAQDPPAAFVALDPPESSPPPSVPSSQLPLLRRAPPY